MTDTDLTTARDLVAHSRRILALTGAGLSTASGIPDFRGPQGRWTQDPEAERISTLSWYLEDDDVRAKAWQARAHSPARTATPNAGHLALVDLEDSGRLAGIVTQNTDGLHLLAGSTPRLVHEVHGNARAWRCEDCGATGAMAAMLARVEAGDPDPRCPECGGITRATVILFEEPLDREILDAAVELAEQADLVLAIGSSLTVHPVAGLVPYAFGHAAKVVILNAEETPYDYLASAIIREPIQDALPALVADLPPVDATA
ncbi:NAD-dependent deacetylase [Propioniciclava coleopterorum]|uniref:protein acetyllysine N-acetyltransferase n=1 Tax=Propioniciclava coleopterorum TaxID=2714937 RepID=A0A6G7Y6A6_9ACTN|nr:Sir2 family NAD-dependent protein deacetylase [Propioniciclava coleopterorum]QIK72352.1 NAD-dependent deacetylase [Propioniciclava coleopterorum]